MADPEAKKKTAPYISFATFQTALDNVASAGVPNIIDRHSFRSFSGGAVAAVLSSFRYFDLISDAGAPSEFLHALANEKDNRKANVKKLLDKYYDSVIALDLVRATPPQLEQAFADARYNVTGATRRKAQAFFLKAAAFTEIPVGKLLMSKSRNVTTSRKPKRPKAVSNTDNNSGDSTNGKGAQDPPVNPDVTRTPIPLGLGRIAYVELPKDWQQTDLRKLIGILELSLGDGNPADNGSA